jgi:hypothetical protein
VPRSNNRLEALAAPSSRSGRLRLSLFAARILLIRAHGVVAQMCHLLSDRCRVCFLVQSPASSRAGVMYASAASHEIKYVTAAEECLEARAARARVQLTSTDQRTYAGRSLETEDLGDFFDRDQIVDIVRVHHI